MFSFSDHVAPSTHQFHYWTVLHRGRSELKQFISEFVVCVVGEKFEWILERHCVFVYYVSVSFKMPRTMFHFAMTSKTNNFFNNLNKLMHWDSLSLLVVSSLNDWKIARMNSIETSRPRCIVSDCRLFHSWQCECVVQLDKRLVVWIDVKYAKSSLWLWHFCVIDEVDLIPWTLRTSVAVCSTVLTICPMQIRPSYKLQQNCTNSRNWNQCVICSFGHKPSCIVLLQLDRFVLFNCKLTDLQIDLLPIDLNSCRDCIGWESIQCR